MIDQSPISFVDSIAHLGPLSGTFEKTLVDLIVRLDGRPSKQLKELKSILIITIDKMCSENSKFLSLVSNPTVIDKLLMIKNDKLKIGVINEVMETQNLCYALKNAAGNKILNQIAKTLSNESGNLGNADNATRLFKTSYRVLSLLNLTQNQIQPLVSNILTYLTNIEFIHNESDLMGCTYYALSILALASEKGILPPIVNQSLPNQLLLKKSASKGSVYFPRILTHINDVIHLILNANEETSPGGGYMEIEYLELVETIQAIQETPDFEENVIRLELFRQKSDPDRSKSNDLLISRFFRKKYM